MTLTDTLTTVFQLQGADQLIASLATSAKGFVGMAAAEGVATAATVTLEAALAVLVTPIALISAGLALLTAGVAGAGVALNAFKESEGTIGRLAVQMKNLGGSFPINDLLNFSGGLSRLTGIDDELIASLGATAAQFGLTRQQIERTLPAVLDIATARNKAPEEVLSTLLRASRGRTQGLLGLGIDPSKIKGDLKDVNNLILQVGAGFAGTAEAFRNTLPGTVNALQTSVGNLFEALGRFISPAVVPLLNLMIAGIDRLTDALSAIADAFPNLFPTAAKLGEGSPSELALKGDPEQTGYLKDIARNTGKLDPLVKQVLSGGGATLQRGITFRDLALSVGV